MLASLRSRLAIGAIAPGTLLPEGKPSRWSLQSRVLPVSEKRGIPSWRNPSIWHRESGRLPPGDEPRVSTIANNVCASGGRPNLDIKVQGPHLPFGGRDADDRATDGDDGVGGRSGDRSRGRGPCCNRPARVS